MRKWMFPLGFAPGLLFPLAALMIALRNPLIFPFASNPALIPMIAFLLAIVLVFSFRKKLKFVQENIHGLTLLFSFTAGYFVLASLFNRMDLNTNNIYFAADNASWLQRMALEDGWNVATRAVHPFAHLIFRPLIVMISVMTGGDRLVANLLAIALAGGGCVFLMWKIVRQISGDDAHAVLFASLLGLSASHLIFAGVIETYIFSAFCLLLFIWLLFSNAPAPWLIVTGVFTFGITITNILQQGMTLLFLQRNPRRAVTLFTLVIGIGIGLNLLSRFVYPSTAYVFLPQNLAGESRFQKQISTSRAILLAENLLIYDIAAPQPYIGMRNGMPRFNFLNGTITQYTWFGWPALILWVALSGLAFFSFLRGIRQTSMEKRLAISLLACLLFNFLLHLGYGAEPFLYSADWTYALVLFCAINLTPWIERNWFRTLLFLLTCFVFINNMWFIYLIARKTSEYLG